MNVSVTQSALLVVTNHWPSVSAVSILGFFQHQQHCACAHHLLARLFFEGSAGVKSQLDIGKYNHSKAYAKMLMLMSPAG